MSESKPCPSCGHSNTVDARFCGRCGTPLAQAPAPAPSPAPRSAQANRTMLGALVDPEPTKPDAPPAAAPAARPQHRTVMGGGFGFDPMTGAPQGAALPPAAIVPPAASTTLGLSASPMSTPGMRVPVEAAAAPMSAPIAPAQVAAPAPAAAAPVAAAPAPVAPVAPAPSVSAPAEPAPARPKEAMRTMMGVGLNPVPAAAPIQPAAPAAAPVVAAAPAPETKSFADTIVDPPRPAAAGAAAGHRTMLGMPTPMIAAVTAPAAPPSQEPQLAAAVPPPSAAAAPPAAIGTEQPTVASPAKRNIGPSNRTMLGVVAPVGRAAPDAGMPVGAVPPSAPAYAPAMPSADTSSTDVSIAGLPSPRRRVRGWLFALLAIGVLLVGSVIAAAFYYRMTRNRADVVAAVADSATGEVLGVDVARAPEGTRARFGTLEQPLTGTHTDFPLAADALHVGDNVVSIDLVFPDGSHETHSVTLTVEYRVRADLSTLSATPPAITVVVDAIPGSTVVLDAQPLTLDAAGHGTRAYPIAAITPDATGVLVLTASYAITPPPPGVAATGTLSSRVPTTVLRVERPADTAVTDHATVVVGGVTQAGATVTVDGAAATVASDGHFSFTAPLTSVGTHELHVAAAMAGRAPASAVLHVERVADLSRAAAAYPVDRTLTYARLAAAPATFVGQHVAIEGRVYNVDLQGGHGVLQMLARDCPAGQRCPLWVTHPAISDIAVESWVRVVGTVAGEQQFMSQSGEVRTVPRVDATYVLSSHP